MELRSNPMGCKVYAVALVISATLQAAPVDAQEGRRLAAQEMRISSPEVAATRSGQRPGRRIVVYKDPAEGLRFVVVVVADGDEVRSVPVPVRHPTLMAMVVDSDFGPGLIRIRLSSRGTSPVSSMSSMAPARREAPSETKEVLLAVGAELRVVRSLIVHSSSVTTGRWRWNESTQELTEIVQPRNRRGRERGMRRPAVTTRMRWRGGEFVPVS